MTPKLPKPPMKGATKAPVATPGLSAVPPQPEAIPPGLQAMTKNDARLVNLDTNTHMDSKGVEHKTHAGNKPRVGPLTIIFASKMGHPPMRFGDHAKLKTNVHKHMRGKGNPHPNALAAEIAQRMRLPRAPQKGAMTNG